MNFKLFPCGADKIPLIKGWQQQATNDPGKLQLWSELYKDKLKYWGVPTGRTNGVLALDIDVKKGDGFKSIAEKHLDVPATMCQRTVSGGAHYLYKYPENGEHYGNRAGIVPHVDTRGEGGYIIWYGGTTAPLAEAPGWLLEAKAQPLVQGTGPTVKVSPEIANGLIMASLDAIREAPEGESNNVLNTESFKVGQLVASGSITREYAEQALFKAAKDRGKPDFEARATITSGLNGGGVKTIQDPFGQPNITIDIPAVPVPERWTPQHFTRHDLFNTHHLRKPQLFEHWSTEDIHITTADGGTGKTTMKLMEAVCLALGDRFLGFNNVQPGKTLFITGEDTASKLGAMIGMIISQMGLLQDQEKIDVVLNSIVVKKDVDLCLISKDKQGFLEPNILAMNKLLEAVEEIKPKMIVFDPISSFWGSEAGVNDMAKAVGKFMGNLVEKSGACVEIINHMGKQSSSNKDMSQFAGRGGTGLPSNARVARVLRGVSDVEYKELTNQDLDEGTSAMMCNISKFTDGSPLLNKPFLILRQGYLFTRKDLDPAQQREEASKASDNERVLAYVKECREQGKYPTDKIVTAYFGAQSDKLSTARVKGSLEILKFSGVEGVKIKNVVHPDATVRQEALVLVDADGKET